MLLYVNVSVVHDTFLLLFQGIVFACRLNGCLYSWPEMNNGVSKCAKLLKGKAFRPGDIKG